MSLTEALRAGAPQAFGALYDEYAGALYAYCHVMVGDEAGDVLRDTFIRVTRHPDAVPGDDAELPVWLHSLARAECVRRGALLRGVVATGSADPLRRALVVLSPEHREVLALSNGLAPEETAQVLGVTRDTAETRVREARWRLERAAASVGGQDAAMLASLSGEALHRLVTLGYEPPAGLREGVLSLPTAGRAPGRTAVFDTDGTPLAPDAFSAQADDATHQFSKISPDEPATEPLRRVEGTSTGTRPDQPVATEPALGEPASAEAVPVGLGSVGTGPDEGPKANTGKQPPYTRGTHAKEREPLLGRLVIPVVGVVALAAVATGVALAWPGSHHADETSAIVHQSARPSRSALPSPSGDQASSPPHAATSTPGASPTPTDTVAAPPPDDTAPADDPESATPTPSATHSSRPKPKPKPHTAAPPRTPRAPTGVHRTPGRRDPGRACQRYPGRVSGCTRPHPWRPWRPQR